MNNLVILIGRITKDLELRTTASGKSALEVNMAINNGKDDTTFIRTTAFGSTADIINKYCKKGSQIGLQCMIRNNNWEDKEGYNNSLVYTYIDEDTYEVGEYSSANGQNAYPYAMAFKRCFDRVVLKKSKLAYSGIYSEVEADEFKQQQKEDFKKETDRLNEIMQLELDLELDHEEILKKCGVESNMDLTEEQAEKLYQWLLNKKEQKENK